MAFRSNQNMSGFGGSNRPNPWLNGEPPALLPTPDIGRGGFGQLLPPQNSLLGIHPSLLNQQQQQQQQHFGQRQVFGNHDLSVFMSNVSNIPQRRMDSRWEMDFEMDAKRLRMNNQSRSGRQEYHNDYRRKSSWQSPSERWRENRSNRDNNRSNQRRKKNDADLRNRLTNKNNNSSNKSEENKKEAEDAEGKSNPERQAYDPASPTSDEEAALDRSASDRKDGKNGGSRKRRKSASPKKTDSSEESATNILQVTIQRGQHGRSVMKDQVDKGTSNAKTLFCNICNVSCPNQENFIKHENSRSHKLFAMRQEKAKKAAEVAESGSADVKDDEEKSVTKECKVCKVNFTGSLIEHMRTKEHKSNKMLMRPYCPQCQQFFRSPAKFVQHCKRERHKQALEEANKEEVESEEETSEAKADSVEPASDEATMEEPSSASVSTNSTVSNKQILKYDPNVAVGQNHLILLSGKFCKLCRKFYKDADVAEQHCKSQTHYQNYVKYTSMKSRGSSGAAASSQDDDMGDSESGQAVESNGNRVKDEPVEEEASVKDEPVMEKAAVKDEPVEEEAAAKEQPMDSEECSNSSVGATNDKVPEASEQDTNGDVVTTMKEESPSPSPQPDQPEQPASSEDGGGDNVDEDDEDEDSALDSSPKKKENVRRKSTPATRRRGRGKGRK